MNKTEAMDESNIRRICRFDGIEIAVSKESVYYTLRSGSSPMDEECAKFDDGIAYYVPDYMFDSLTEKQLSYYVNKNLYDEVIPIDIADAADMCVKVAKAVKALHDEIPDLEPYMEYIFAVGDMVDVVIGSLDIKRE